MVYCTVRCREEAQEDNMSGLDSMFYQHSRCLNHSVPGTYRHRKCTYLKYYVTCIIINIFYFIIDISSICFLKPREKINAAV